MKTKNVQLSRPQKFDDLMRKVIKVPPIKNKMLPRTHNKKQNDPKGEYFRNGCPSKYLVTVWEGSELLDSWNAEDVEIDGRGKTVLVKVTLPA